MKSYEIWHILINWCRISINSIIYLISICSLNLFFFLMNCNLLSSQDGKATPYCPNLTKTHPTSDQISALISIPAKFIRNSSMRVGGVASACLNHVMQMQAKQLLLIQSLQRTCTSTSTRTHTFRAPKELNKLNELNLSISFRNISRSLLFFLKFLNAHPYNLNCPKWRTVDAVFFGASTAKPRPPKAFSNICCRSLRRRFNSFLIERLGGAIKLRVNAR